MPQNQFIREVPAPTRIFQLLLVLIPFTGIPAILLPAPVQELCFRKFDAKRNACKYLVSDRDSSENQTRDIEICCSTYGQGYATQLKRREQLRRKWYACTPCHPVESSRNQELNLESSTSITPVAHSYQADKQVSGSSDVVAKRISAAQQDDLLTSAFDELMKEFGDEDSLKDRKDDAEFKVVNYTKLDWGPWSDWTACSRTCGPPEGTQRRYRRHCPGGEGPEACAEEFEQRTCQPNLHCKVDGGWSNWTVASCSVTCGEGHQVLSRLCNNPLPAGGGKDCQGDMEDVRPCINPACPVDGEWSDWSDWTPCPAVCGVGVQTRTRTCTNPSPRDGGRPCRGLQEQSAPCSSRSNCPVNGNWSEWSKWDICSAKPCSGKAGHRIRFRTCTNPRPMYGGRSCRGRAWSREVCYNNEYCTEKVNGGWCLWSNWTDCASEVQIRTRGCHCPPPANGGSECDGVKMEERICTVEQVAALKRRTRTEKAGQKSGCKADSGSGTEDTIDSTPEDCMEEDEENGDDDTVESSGSD